MTLTLHKSTFAAFAPYINIYDPGARNYEGEIVHAIPKEWWSLQSAWKAGERNLTYKGVPWTAQDIGKAIFNASRVERHFRGYTSYATGGKNGRTIFLCDFDAHKHYQSNEDAATAADILGWYWKQTFGITPYGRESTRGYHLFPKLCYFDSQEGDDDEKPSRQLLNYVNAFYARLQDAVNKILLLHKNQCDFEVKITITTPAKSGMLGKLPFHDGWNEEHLYRFRQSPEVGLLQLLRFIEKLETTCNTYQRDILPQKHFKEQMDAEWIGVKADKDAAEKANAARQIEEIRAIRARTERVAPLPSSVAPDDVQVTPPSEIITTQVEQQAEFAKNSVETGFNSSIWRVKLTDRATMTNPDAFDRQHQAMLELCRYCGRVVSVDEALLFIHERELYSPPWDNDDRNGRRIQYHLDYIAKTFKPTRQEPEVQWDRYDQYFKKAGEQLWVHYTENGKEVKRLLTPKVKSVFLAAMQFCLENQERSDNTVPRSRLYALINQFSAISVDHWMLTCLFEWVVDAQMLECDLDAYGPQQARRWSIGMYHPDALRTEFQKCACDVGRPLIEFATTRLARITLTLHNTVNPLVETPPFLDDNTLFNSMLKGIFSYHDTS